MLYLKTAKTVLQELSKHDLSICCINGGGCGIFAANLYRLFNKLEVPCEIVVASLHSLTVIKAMSDRQQDATDAYITHILVKVGELYADSEGLHSKDFVINYLPLNGDLDIIPGLDIELLDLWNSYPPNWNSSFSREAIPYLINIFEFVEQEMLQSA